MTAGAAARASDLPADPTTVEVPGVLHCLGLTPAELAVYRAVVQLGEMEPAGLASALGLTRATVDTTVRTLVEQGFLSWASRVPDRVQAADPNVALRPRLARAARGVDQAHTLTAELIEDYYASRRRHDVVRLLDVITGSMAIREALDALQRDATGEMLWLCKANPVALPSPDNTEEAEALARGVRYRVLYERSLLTEPGMMTNIAAGIELGETARVLPALPVRLAVADGGRAIIPLTTTLMPGQEPTAAVVHDSTLCVALVALFESLWERATPLERLADPTKPPPAGQHDHLDADDRYLLSLLVSGVPDKAIATQLGVSYRTVQRRVSTLMETMNVETRIELAYVVGRDRSL